MNWAAARKSIKLSGASISEAFGSRRSEMFDDRRISEIFSLIFPHKTAKSSLEINCHISITYIYDAKILEIRLRDTYTRIYLYLHAEEIGYFSKYACSKMHAEISAHVIISLVILAAYNISQGYIH